MDCLRTRPSWPRTAHIRSSVLGLSWLIALNGAAALPVSPASGSDPLKVTGIPLTDGNGGNALTEAANIANHSPGMEIAITRSQDGSYHLDGTAWGENIPPTDLWVHETTEFGATPDGITSSSATSGDMSLRDGLLRSPAGKITVTLMHELKHLALTAQYPAFAEQCPDCAEQVCYASTATDACALANNCEEDLNGEATDDDETERTDLVRAADEQNQSCETEKESHPNACSSCTASPKPAIPACPGPCNHEPCPE